MQQNRQENMDLEKVTRVEVIDHSKGGTGREYVKWQEGIKVQFFLQDEERTLKIFIEDRDETRE